MSEPIEVGAQEISRNLEERLAAARREKGLAQVPALRRLRYVVRVLLVLSSITLVFTVFQGFFVRETWDLVAATAGLSSRLAFVLYVVVGWLSLALGWLQFYCYTRFLRQFKRNHLEDLRETAVIIPRLLVYGIALTLVLLPIGIAMFQNMEERVGFASGLLLGLAVAFGMFLVIRHYVRTAMADFDALRAATGAEGQRGRYPRWWSAYGVLLLIALAVLAIGYSLAGEVAPG